jgi:serine/threonine-protein kinase
MGDVPDGLRTALAGRYDLDKEIGRGGMATVYLARDRKHRRKVAVKVFRSELSASVGTERFLREIEIAAQLSHPHILPLYDSGHADGFLYYVMPYVEGESLRERLRLEQQLPVEEALEIGVEVADALAHAHSSGVVHRDIKPENILFAAGQPVIADFGMARAVTMLDGKELTDVGIAVGTPTYMSPEQATGAERQDHRSDVYALGCVVYEMLAGIPPFVGPSAQAVMARHSTDPVPPLRTVRESIPESVERVVLRALAKTPADRYTTAAQFADALRKAQTEWISYSSGATVVTQASGHGSSATWLKRSLVPVVVVAAALLIWRPWSGGQSPAVATAPAYGDSIAVKPVVNLTGRGILDHVAEVVTHDLIGYLTQFPQIKVTSLHSVRALADARLTSRQLAESLGVRLVLEARFLSRGDGFLVQASLIDAMRDASLWNDAWGSDLSDPGAAEVEMVRRIGEAIAQRVEGTAVAEARLPPEHAQREAAEAYQIGRHWLPRRTPEGIRRAIAAFREAVARDSTYAPAYAGLSSAYSLALAYRYDIGLDGYGTAGRSLALADRAVALDSTLASAFAARGYLESRSFAPTPTVATDCERVLALQPSGADGPSWCARVLAQQGDIDAAFAEAERAVALDPLSAGRRLALAYEALGSRRYNLAIQQAQMASALEPELVLPLAIEARARLLAGDAAGCVGMELGPHAVLRAMCVRELGRIDEASAIVDSVLSLVEPGALVDTVFTEVIRAEDLATYYGWIGDAGAALRWLVRAYDLSPSGVEVRVLESELFRRVRSDAAFAEGVARVRGSIWPRVEAASRGFASPAPTP